MKDDFLDEIGATLPCTLDIWQIPVPFSKLLRSCMRRCRFAYLLHWSAKERLVVTLSRMWRYIGIVWGQRWHYKSIESLRPSNAKHIFTLFYILDGSAGTAVAHGNFWWNHCQVVLHAIGAVWEGKQWYLVGASSCIWKFWNKSSSCLQVYAVISCHFHIITPSQTLVECRQRPNDEHLQRHGFRSRHDARKVCWHAGMTLPSVVCGNCSW